MKLHSDKLDIQSITGYGDGWIAVNGQRHFHSLVITPKGALLPWPCARFESLDISHFDLLLEQASEPPELIVFGSGARLRFAPPVLMRGLMARRIGVETMDTAAACRTYNILAGEGRRVVAALLLET
ncbi:MAG: Mth938-like domain-containing protein [Hydrogenophaga sp.]|uniref:Mth938-like domain-containing protein n=1 Tax=Hydrogenophaga sp. TaxID=1904254 RepID=UPI002AB869E9|nr:Mth938-like domain-containing protein [Hydrogenophaga sp.]MDZ4280355.1 Mth938-like domain-containing protein [Hydrogenophaga sp.]